MVDAGCRKIVFFPLYPQAAGATTATANDQFFRALQEEKWQPSVRTVPEYFDRPSYIEALAQSLRGFLLATKQEAPLRSELDFGIRGHRNRHGRGERRY